MVNNRNKVKNENTNTKTKTKEEIYFNQALLYCHLFYVIVI